MTSQVVLPGDSINYVTPETDSTIDPSLFRIQFGPALIPSSKLDSNTIRDKPTNQKLVTPVISTKAGVLRHVENGSLHKYWVDQNQKRYIPQVNESVIGIVRARFGEGYRVDIGSAGTANLGALTFEGATKRNRPNLPVSTLVYGRIVFANKDMDPDMECMGSTGRAEGYGELKGGFMLTCSLGLARNLFHAKSPILEALGQRIPFEIAVGLNGRVWIKADSTKNTILVMKAIQHSEMLTLAQCKELVKELFKRLKEEDTS